MSAKRITLPVFVLMEPTHCNDPLGNEVNFKIPGSTIDYTYFDRPVVTPDGLAVQCNSFSIVICGNGAPWADACLYLLSKLDCSPIRASMKTIISIADDLAAYKEYIEVEGVDYKLFLRNKLLRPTYRYRGHLEIKIRTGEIARSTARRRMQTVIGFYRWLRAEKKIEPNYPMWSDQDRFISVTDNYGFNNSIRVKSSDLAVKSNTQKDPYSGYINDGGKLRPLPFEQQVMLLGTLFELRNTEIILMHLVSLFTGARIQTVGTLKVRHFRVEVDGNRGDVPLECGPGTGIDTKNGKRLTIFIPIWLYEKLRSYSYSQRFSRRYVKFNRNDIEENCYLFLSSHGNPFYEDSYDSQIFDVNRKTRQGRSGGSIRTYMSRYICPILRKKLGKDFHYQFHDLRASFGMNLTDAQLCMVNSGVITLHEAREFVKSRMSHQSSSTTDLYLRYRKTSAHLSLVQRDYEEYLRELIYIANSGFGSSSYD